MFRGIDVSLAIKKWAMTPDDALQMLKPEKPTMEEVQAAEKISLEEYSIYLERLNMFCEEAKETFVRSGVTTMLRSGDLAVGIYTFNGDLVTALCGTFLHTVTITPMIKFILKRYGHLVKEGDVWFHNDPLFGGIHPMDNYCAMPVFYNNKLIAWVSAAVHEAEVGASEPGMPSNARSRYEEGYIFSPVRIAENYQIKEDLVEAIGNRTRTPRAVSLDIRARIAACDRLRLRMIELAEEKGIDFIIGLLRKAIVETEKGVREKIKRWLDGTFRAVVFQDAIGTYPGLVKATLTVRKKGERILFDFSEGTSPENPTAYNTFGHVTASHVMQILYGWVHYDMAPCSALWNVYDFKFKKGTMLHANEEAATNKGTPLNVITFYLVLAVLSKMMYIDEESRLKNVAIGIASSHSDLILSGVNQWGEPFTDFHGIAFNSCGWGARAARDGVDAASFIHCPWGKAPDVEEVEREMPLLHLFMGHVTDSCGFGKYRGGSANSTVFIHYGKTPLTWTSFGAGNLVPVGSGLFGGYPGRAMADLKIRNCDIIEKLRKGEKNVPKTFLEFFSSKTLSGKREVTHTALGGLAGMLFPSDLAVTTSGGGQGYGDPLERDPDLVIKDLESGIISEWTARNIYKVAYNPETNEVDHEETQRLRQQERELRKKLGKKYEEWEKEWSGKAPPQEFLKFYGKWPTAESE
jgi:N-methylhydantoinase B/oxoprolinase/acetone carboxylase alpha subunit